MVKHSNKLSGITAIILLLISTQASAMNVTFINPGKPGERFWAMVTETMQAAAEDLDIELEVLYALRNRMRMTRLGIDVTARKVPPDYLILVNEEQAAEQIINAANQKSIHTLMLLNDFLPEQYSRIGRPGDQGSYILGAVTPDNYSTGKRMMNTLINCAKKINPDTPVHILALGGDQLTPASLDRNAGAIAALKAHPSIVLDRFLYADWRQEAAERLTKNYLIWAQKNHVKPTAIWSANDPIAAGARDALLKHNIKPGQDVCLVGLNWSAQGLKMVKHGEMLATEGGHFLAGAWSMVLLQAYHKNQQQGANKPIGHVQIQMQSIDKNNINRYLSHLGNENWGKIDFSRFSTPEQAGYDHYDFSLDAVFTNLTEKSQVAR
ncbi:MAG: ABC transporter substrate-binding protein [Pontibacterium sp.]